MEDTTPMSEEKNASGEASAQPKHPPVPRRASDVRTVPAEKTFWSALDEIWAEVPDEELRKLPTDLAAQHDHYIYGLPKKAK